MDGFTKTATRNQRALDLTMKRIDRVIGAKPDTDMVFYENLRPGDFQALEKVYGTDQVQGYIREMEMKRMKEARRG